MKYKTKIKKAMQLLKEASHELKQGDIDAVVISDQIEAVLERMDEDVVPELDGLFV